MNRWSVEQAEAAFRVVVFYACSGVISGYLGSIEINQVKRFYNLATHNNGYRSHLINAIVKMQDEDDHLHVLHQHWDDFPDASLCFGYETRDGVLARTWLKREKDFLETKMESLVQKYHQDQYSTLDTSDISSHTTLVLQEPSCSKMSIIGHLAGCRVVHESESPSKAKKSKLGPLSKKKMDRHGAIVPTPNLSSLNFLDMDTLGEEVYAYGYFVIKQMAEESDPLNVNSEN
jgi:hypothetical protein